MDLTELAHATGVAPHAIRHYIDLELVPPPTTSVSERDVFGIAHKERLRIVHYLMEYARLSAGDITQIISAFESEAHSVDDLLALTHSLRPTEYPNDPVCGEIRVLMRELGWDVPIDSSLLSTLSTQVTMARVAGLLLDHEHLLRYAKATELIATVDLDVAKDAKSRADAIVSVAVGALASDQILASLRRLAQIAQA